MPRVTPAQPQANAIYITPKWSSLFKRTLTGGQANYEPKLFNVKLQKLSEVIFLPLVVVQFQRDRFILFLYSQ